MNDSDLVIVVPLWRRTVHIERVAASAAAATPDAQVLFVASVEDLYVVSELERLELDHMVLPGPGGGHGDYSVKINAGYRASAPTPFIFTGADDLHFTPGWYDAARAEMSATVGVVGTVDLCNQRTMNGAHSTHSLVARWYADLGTIDEPHAIYHTGYWHEFCDDELCATARHRDAYAHAYGAVVEHLHPNANKGVDDETYERGRSRSMLSRKLFLNRSALWGGAGRGNFQPRQVYAKRPVIEQR